MTKALIVGGGIGGLAAAVALSQRGWDVEVFERAPRFAEVGAGLSLWPNAVTALTDLGVADRVVAQAVPHRQGGIRDASGRWLMRTDGAALRTRFGAVLMIHRADLLDLLREALPDDVVLHPGVTVHRADGSGVIHHSRGSASGDVLIGADGIRSVVRDSLWGHIAPRYAGYTAWRFVTASPLPAISDSGESWGRGSRFGYAPLPDGRIYCYAVANAPEGAAGDGLRELWHRFGDWHDRFRGC